MFSYRKLRAVNPTTIQIWTLSALYTKWDGLMLATLWYYLTIMCRNDELSWTISWVACFILIAENTQILLKIFVIPILLTFIYLVAFTLRFLLYVLVLLYVLFWFS